MRFSYNKNNSKWCGELLYVQNEYSLTYKPYCKNINVSIIIGAYTSLDTVIETGEVVHMSGLNPKDTWIPKVMEFPKSEKGELFVHFDKPPMKGTGKKYAESWVTYCDPDNFFICIGNPNIEDSDVCIEFANGIVAVIKKDQLISIWAKFRVIAP